MSKAAHIILDGDNDTHQQPSVTQQEEFWRPIMEHGTPLEADECEDLDQRLANELNEIYSPISLKEVREIKPAKGTAAGPDGALSV